MDINSVRAALSRPLLSGLDIHERRQGNYQLIVPILYEDGDMVDIFLLESPQGDGYVRLSDFGMTMMRLSYTYDLNSNARQRIFDSILVNNGVLCSDGHLYLDAPIATLQECILQFAGCEQKVCNMRYWSREIVRSAFYDDLAEYITTEMALFSPAPEQSPLTEYPLSVDWSLTLNNRQFYVFGVRGNDKAKNVAIALLEFQKAQLPFISLVVHEDMEELGRKESIYLTRNSDTQYPVLRDFQEQGVKDINRFAGVVL